MKEKIFVSFEGGESRNGFDKQGVNYMLANTINENGDSVELYAEVKVEDSPFELDYSGAETPNEKAEIADKFDHDGFDSYSYPLLKEEIIRQAIENGINPEKLRFYCD